MKLQSPKTKPSLQQNPADVKKETPLSRNGSGLMKQKILPNLNRRTISGNSHRQIQTNQMDGLDYSAHSDSMASQSGCVLAMITAWIRHWNLHWQTKSWGLKIICSASIVAGPVCSGIQSLERWFSSAWVDSKSQHPTELVMKPRHQASIEGDHRMWHQETTIPETTRSYQDEMLNPESFSSHRIKKRTVVPPLTRGAVHHRAADKVVLATTRAQQQRVPALPLDTHANACLARNDQMRQMKLREIYGRSRGGTRHARARDNCDDQLITRNYEKKLV